MLFTLNCKHGILFKKTHPNQYIILKLRKLDVRLSGVIIIPRITPCPQPVRDISHTVAMYLQAACGGEWSFSTARDEVGARSPWLPDDLRYSLPDGYRPVCRLLSAARPTPSPSTLKHTAVQTDHEINTCTMEFIGQIFTLLRNTLACNHVCMCTHT